MLKWTFGYIITFLTQASVIFIQENAAFIQVLIYQDWHNQLLNTIIWYICTQANITKTSCVYWQNFKEIRKKTH